MKRKPALSTEERLAQKINTFPSFAATVEGSMVKVTHEGKPVGGILLQRCQNKTLCKDYHLHPNIRRELMDRLYPGDTRSDLYFAVP